MTLSMKDVLKYFLLFFLLKIEIFSQDSSLFKKTFPLESKLLHKTPNPFFQGRPYFLELFSDIPLDSLESINFYFKTDKSKNYREEKLEFFRGSYRFKYDPKFYPGKKIYYFFIAKITNSGMYAFPINDQGMLNPIELDFVDPIKYYNERTP
tara:strand:+ start:1308 stop:1763 length:456 start_codon:yes stop_codon:yes gene_type:complete